MGKTIRMAGFQSTTFKPGVAESFIKPMNRFGGGIILEIRTDRGAFIKDVSKVKKEHELLLDEDTKFRVVAHKTVKLRSTDQGKTIDQDIIQLSQAHS